MDVGGLNEVNKMIHVFDENVLNVRSETTALPIIIIEAVQIRQVHPLNRIHFIILLNTSMIIA